jgi:predicted 2-oxoglutarate/Fe(II)-dependent dioxygenase YbiX
MENLKDLIFTGNFKNPELNAAFNFEIESNNLRSFIYDASEEKNFNKKMRRCGISWIPVNKNLLIDKVLTKIVRQVNKEKNWNHNLSDWQCDIQYTYYYNQKDHYDWHSDVLKSKNPLDKRLISVVYCLSSKNDYEGALLEFKRGSEIISMKLDIGDFVVFQSHLIHRVSKLIDGERETLVGWYR